jgi:hypothetical protein
MAGATERKLLVLSRQGDEIGVGWRVGEKWAARDRKPIADWIAAQGSNKRLRVKSAFETVGILGYDYVHGNTETRHASDSGIGFVRLECTQGGIKPVELLQPVYDLCELVSAPHIWYDQASLPDSERGKYCVEEPRAVFRRERRWDILGRWDLDSAGTYYPSYAKILALIEKLTTPWAQDDITAMLHMRDMISVDAYYAFKRTGRTDEAANWRLAQERMAERVLWYMRNNPWSDIGQERWLDISWQPEAPNGTPSIKKLGKLDVGDSRGIFVPLLRLLKGNESIHLVDMAISEWSYVNGAMAWASPSPGDLSEPAREKSA